MWHDPGRPVGPLGYARAGPVSFVAPPEVPAAGCPSEDPRNPDLSQAVAPGPGSVFTAASVESSVLP